MKFCELLKIASQKLEDNGIEEYSNDAWLLMEDAFSMSRAEYYMKMNEEADGDLINDYFDNISKRCKRIPLQHITGKQEFMGFTFLVNEHVLIPRQDTEVLVQRAIELIKEKAYTERRDVSDIKVLDMCTGSGCIAISVAKILGLNNCAAVDLSEKALEVAMKNAKINDTNIRFVNSDLFGNIKEKYDIVISNPPYIRTEVIGELMPEVREYEPMMALDGTADGLQFYKEITKQSVMHLESKGILIYEIGYDQAMDVKNILQNEGFTDIIVKKDLPGLDRVIEGRLKY